MLEELSMYNDPEILDEIFPLIAKRLELAIILPETGQVLELKDSPQLESLITEIFTSTD